MEYRATQHDSPPTSICYLSCLDWYRPRREQTAHLEQRRLLGHPQRSAWISGSMRTRREQRRGHGYRGRRPTGPEEPQRQRQYAAVGGRPPASGRPAVGQARAVSAMTQHVG